MCAARVINRHWKGKVHVGFGLSVLQNVACARRCEVRSQVFVRGSEHLFPPLQGLPTSCVFVPRCAPVMGAGPTLTQPGPEPDSAKMSFFSNFSFPVKRRAVQECRARWSLAAVHLYDQTQDLSTAVATVTQ